MYLTQTKSVSRFSDFIQSKALTWCVCVCVCIYCTTPGMPALLHNIYKIM